VQEVTGEHGRLAWVVLGYTGDEAREAAAAHSIPLLVVKHAQAKRGFVPLPAGGGAKFRVDGARQKTAYVPSSSQLSSQAK
jgi:hypothetical protein